MYDSQNAEKEEGSVSKPKQYAILYEKLFGSDERCDHKRYPDLLRMMAAIFVIGIHTVSLAAAMVPADSLQYSILTVFVFTFISCNQLFVMVSGALLLPVKNERIGTFYAKRFVKVAVPLVVCYVLYVIAKNGISVVSPENLPGLFVRILSGAPEEAPHLWLVYVILMLYLYTPFLRYLLSHIPDRVFYGLLSVFLLIDAGNTFAPLFGFNAPLPVISESFVSVYLTGYFLAEKCAGKISYRIIVAGGASYFFACVLILCTNGYEPYIYQTSPIMTFFCAAVFLLVKNRNYRDGKYLFVRLVCRYSYSILLLHWGVLHFVVKQVLHVNVLSGGIVGGCILMALLTFLISLAGAIILDNTLIAWILSLFRKLFGQT